MLNKMTVTASLVGMQNGLCLIAKAHTQMSLGPGKAKLLGMEMLLRNAKEDNPVLFNRTQDPSKAHPHESVSEHMAKLMTAVNTTFFGLAGSTLRLVGYTSSLNLKRDNERINDTFLKVTTFVTF